MSEKMKVAYIAGPYRADTISEIRHNIRRAEDAAEVLWKSGYAVICPHKNSGFFDGLVPDKQFLDAGLRFVEIADVVFVLKGWPGSVGSKAEVDRAKELGIEIDYMFVGPGMD